MSVEKRNDPVAASVLETFVSGHNLERTPLASVLDERDPVLLIFLRHLG